MIDMYVFPKHLIGYTALLESFKIKALPHFCKSSLSYTTNVINRSIINDIIITNYPKAYALKNHQNALEHIAFALKYEGINLSILSQVFIHLGMKEITTYIQEHPTGKMTRKIWFLYEFLTQNTLEITDCKNGPYHELVDTKLYYTTPNKPSKRHRIHNNLLGNIDFCPIVRKTTLLEKFESLHLDKIAMHIVNEYDPSILSRAAYYLYTKETLSSNKIEQEQSNVTKIERYIKLITSISSYPTLDKTTLLTLQNALVDTRFQDHDYRTTQNYVGEIVHNFQPKIHFISPKPKDVPSLMNGLLACLEHHLDFNTLEHSQIPPVIIAAMIAFGFVFIHPFEDGNGRIHRYLIHYILLHTKFTPQDLIFPISATILANLQSYDKALEMFSVPLLNVIENYNLTDEGNLTVEQDTKYLYQYIDYTQLAEYLFACIEKTINTFFKDELNYIVLYDKLKSAIYNIIELPDKKLTLIVNFIIHNQGKLSLSKRKKYFSMLTDDEIIDIEQAFKRCVS